MGSDSKWNRPHVDPGSWLYTIHELRRVRAILEDFRKMGEVNPRQSGWHNDLIQLVKKLMAHWLARYVEPRLNEFSATVSRSLPEILYAIENLSANMVALERRLAEAEIRTATQTGRRHEQLELLHGQVSELGGFQQATQSQAGQHPRTGWQGKKSRDPQWDRPQADVSPPLYGIDILRRAAATLEDLRYTVGTVHPGPSGWHSDTIQPRMTLPARLRAWYVRPFREFNVFVSRSLQEIFYAIEDLSKGMVALERRLEEDKERTDATAAEPMQEQLQFLREQVNAFVRLPQTAHLQAGQRPEKGEKSPDPWWDPPEADPGLWLYDIDDLRRAGAALEELRLNVATVNPRPSGWHKDLIQLPERLLARLLAGYVRPLWEFNDRVSRSLQEIFCAIENLSAGMVVLERQLAEAERRTATQAEAIQEEMEFLHEEVTAVVSLHHTSKLRAPAGSVEIDSGKNRRENSSPFTGTGLRNNRTAYVIGLFGSGRLYINALMLQNIGERAKYLRDFIRLHPGPTPMIYSGHATTRHVSRAQAPPVVMNGILEAVRSRFADLIFVCRHPLDSLLTNWFWWRTFIQDHKVVSGISEVYRNSDDLCADVERYFPELQGFAEGDPAFFAAAPGQPFLSFPEYVEESELLLQAATLSLRLEDFMIDPAKEFSKIADVMSVDPDLSCSCLPRPRAKPYRYVAVAEKVSRFRNLVNGLNAITKERIENMGYSVLDGGRL
jgi:hypothetical protein